VLTDYIYLANNLIGIYVPGSSPPTTGKLYYVQGDRQGTPQLVTDSSQERGLERALWEPP